MPRKQAEGWCRGGSRHRSLLLVCVGHFLGQVALSHRAHGQLPPLLITAYYRHPATAGAGPARCTGAPNALDIRAIDAPLPLQGGCLLEQAAENRSGCRALSPTESNCTFLAGTQPTAHGCAVPPAAAWLLAWNRGCTGSATPAGVLVPYNSTADCAAAAAHAGATSLDTCTSVGQCFTCMSWDDLVGGPTAPPNLTAVAACPLFPAPPVVTSTLPRGGRGTFVANATSSLCSCLEAPLFYLPPGECSLQRVPIDCREYGAGSTGCGNPCQDCSCVDLGALATPPVVAVEPWDLQCPGAVTLTTTTSTQRLTRPPPGPPPEALLPVCAQPCLPGSAGACRQRGVGGPRCLNVTRAACAQQNNPAGAWGQPWSFCADRVLPTALPRPGTTQHSCAPTRVDGDVNGGGLSAATGSCCDAWGWTVDLAGFTCVGGSSSSAATSTECAAKCCGQPNCTGWQWCSGAVDGGCRRRHCKLLVRSECVFVDWDTTTAGDAALQGFIGRSLPCGTSDLSCAPTAAPTTAAPTLTGSTRAGDGGKGGPATRVSVGEEAAIGIGILLVLVLVLVLALFLCHRGKDPKTGDYRLRDDTTSLLPNPTYAGLPLDCGYAEIGPGDEPPASTSGTITYVPVTAPTADAGLSSRPIYATASSAQPAAQPVYSFADKEKGPAAGPMAGGAQPIYAVAGQVPPPTQQPVYSLADPEPTLAGSIQGDRESTAQPEYSYADQE